MMSKRSPRQFGWTVLAIAGAFACGWILGGPQQGAAEPQQHANHDGHDGHGHGATARNEANWAPLSKMHLYLCAFHVAKENPSFQIEAHHYCAPVGDIHQCVIYDSRSGNQKLLGTEYIISDEQYRKLPDKEKRYWHPHAYEILSGQLIAGDMPDQGDAMFPGLITTWGKTWHTWPDPTTNVPMGEPLLMWSANGDGQVSQSLIGKRDAQFGISTDAIRARRKSMGYEVPQIPPPKSKDDLGRTWTASGPDEPKKLPQK